MGKDHVGARKYQFAIKVIDKNQHWDGESYPWTLGTYSRIERQIGNISQITW
jgi:hypothetical protein